MILLGSRVVAGSLGALLLPDQFAIDLPERVGYRIKRAVLGPPLVNAALREEKLSKKAALGVLSSDCISSSAYGSEEMLIVLLPSSGWPDSTSCCR